MDKAYDRVDRKFLIIVLENLGFFGGFIDVIWRLVANNWYSVLVNSLDHGFFHSTRGVKQGDTLSPSLFILSTEVLSRALTSLFLARNFRSF